METSLGIWCVRGFRYDVMIVWIFFSFFFFSSSFFFFLSHAYSHSHVTIFRTSIQELEKELQKVTRLYASSQELQQQQQQQQQKEATSSVAKTSTAVPSGDKVGDEKEKSEKKTSFVTPVMVSRLAVARKAALNSSSSSSSVSTKNGLFLDTTTSSSSSAASTSSAYASRHQPCNLSIFRTPAIHQVHSCNRNKWNDETVRWEKTHQITNKYNERFQSTATLLEGRKIFSIFYGPAE